MSFASLLNKTATVKRDTAQVRVGGMAIASTATLETIACTIQPLTAKELIEDRNLTVDDFRGFFPFSATLAAKDRIVVDSVTYELKSPAFDAAGRGHHREAILKRITV